MNFEWDEEKRLANIRKHGVDFLDAALVFEGETIEWVDDRDDYGEERIIALGLSGLNVLRLTFTLRGEIIRIISVQRASKNDQKRYVKTVDPR